MTGRELIKVKPKEIKEEDNKNEDDPIKKEESILEGYNNITILQSLDHKYFALNSSNMRRTRGVDSIYDISKTFLDTIK